MNLTSLLVSSHPAINSQSLSLGGSYISNSFKLFPVRIMNTQNLVSNLHANFPVGIASSNEDFQVICIINDVPPNA